MDTALRARRVEFSKKFKAFEKQVKQSNKNPLGQSYDQKAVEQAARFIDSKFDDLLDKMYQSDSRIHLYYLKTFSQFWLKYRQVLKANPELAYNNLIEQYVHITDIMNKKGYSHHLRTFYELIVSKPEREAELYEKACVYTIGSIMVLFILFHKYKKDAVPLAKGFSSISEVKRESTLILLRTMADIEKENAFVDEGNKIDLDED